MKKLGKICLIVAAFNAAAVSCVVADTTVSVDDVPVALDFNGFVRADYGNGNRYAVADGESRFGTTKSFLVIGMKTDNVRAILDFGGTILTNTKSGGDASGNVGFKDAFIIVGDASPTGFSFSVGAQPLLFGLRPNGYPGDSSLQANIDYGSVPGAFNVSQQGGPSIIGTYKFTPDESVRFGAGEGQFTGTPYAYNLNSTNGSKLQHNLFALWRGNSIGGTGLYATAGYERLYVGGRYDSSKSIYSAGLGFKQQWFDVSAEYIHLDRDIIDAVLDLGGIGGSQAYINSNEHYIRVHAEASPVKPYTIYVDYSHAQELGASTYRIGGNWQYRKHLSLMVEFSRDRYSGNNQVYTTAATGGAGFPGLAVPPNRSSQSVDARLTFNY